MDFSLLGLFLNAHIVVQMIVFLLALASIATWAIVLERFFFFKKLKLQGTQFESGFFSGASLSELYNELHQKEKQNPFSLLFLAMVHEWNYDQKELNNLSQKSLEGRIERIANVSISKEVSGFERYLLFLSTTGSSSPFIGLLGTVIGIINSFQGIVHSQSATLMSVAPGIAEALFATAFGLFVAIPAVIAYNAFHKKSQELSDRLYNLSHEIEIVIMRQWSQKEPSYKNSIIIEE